MDTNALISLKHVVASLQNEQDDYSPANQKRLLSLAVEGLSHLNIFYTTAIKVTYLTVADTNTVDVPEDYIDYYRIGLIINGKIWTLSKNDNIPIVNSMDCGAWEGDTTNQEPVDMPYEWHYSFTGGHNVGYYRYDPELRRLVFSGNMMGQQIVLEYISTGVSLSGETWVRRETAKVLKDYIYWKSIQRKEDVAMNLKLMAKQDYYESLGEYTRFSYSFTVDELLDSIRKGRRQTIKG